MKPKIREVIVVEGRYDKNTLAQVVDAAIIPVGGFSAFHDRELLSLLRRLAQTRGLVLLTDPDGAGFVIRNRLKGALPKEGIKQAYVPDVYGKERRKKHGGKEGKLGVEGMAPDVLLAALRRAGATFEGEESADRSGAVTKSDLLDAGLIGDGSAARRAALIRRLSLPEHLSANALLDVLNLLWTRREFWLHCAVGCGVSGEIDRPIGSRHPEHPDMIYPVNYGWVKGISAPDGEEQDAYVLGADEPLETFTGKVVAVWHRLDDVEDKWIVSLDGRDYSDEEITEKIRFQECRFRGELLRG